MTEPEEFPSTQEAFDAMHRQVEGLEAEISELKELIRQMLDLNENKVDRVEPYEVVQILATWVNEDDR